MSDSVPGHPVVLFAQDGEVLTFPSPEAAATYMEPMDILDVEYPHIFGLDGQVFRATMVSGGGIKLNPTGSNDVVALRSLLIDHGAQEGAVDTAELVEQVLALQRNNRKHWWSRTFGRSMRRNR